MTWQTAGDPIPDLIAPLGATRGRVPNGFISHLVGRILDMRKCLVPLVLGAVVATNQDCHLVCTQVRPQLDPKKACKSSRRHPDRSVGRACEIGFENGYHHACMDLCETRDYNAFSRPDGACNQINHASRKAENACRSGWGCIFALNWLFNTAYPVQGTIACLGSLHKV